MSTTIAVTAASASPAPPAVGSKVQVNVAGVPLWLEIVETGTDIVCKVIQDIPAVLATVLAPGANIGIVAADILALHPDVVSLEALIAQVKTSKHKCSIL
jgi:hypothetical protein